MSGEIMKGKIALIKEVMNEQEILLGYECVIEFEQKPDLKLGNCEVKQK